MKTTFFTKIFLALIVTGAFSIFHANSQTVNAPGGLTSGYIPYAGPPSGSTSNIYNSPIYNSGSNIGIGTTAPGTYRLYVLGNTYTSGTITANGAIISIGHNNNNGGITNAGAISGASTISASGLITSTGHNNNNGGITNAGAISGASTISASGLITSTGHNNNNGGITNTGTISGASNITASGAISGASLTASGGVTGATITASSGDFNTTSALQGYQIGGTYVLRNNNNANDIFVGVNAGNAAMTGHNNSFVGFLTGQNNTTGTQNVAVGSYAARVNQTGSFNTLAGYQAGYNTNAGNNSFFGWRAGYNNTSGTNNTCIGNGADLGSGSYSNASSFGNGAVNNQGSNTIYFGSSLTGIYSSLGTLQGSDSRFKFNVSENVKGLEFIKKLRPVTYQMDTKKLDDFIIQDMPDSLKAKHKKGMDFAPSTSAVHSGFLAQEVEKAANACGFKSSIVSIPANPNKSHYSLNYAELVVPLVKAVQELSATVDNLQSQIAALKGAAQRKAEIPSTEAELVNKSAVLFQNTPNPFGDGTAVKYFVPENSIGASIIFFDESGNEIKNVELPDKGVTAELNVAAMNLAAGIYSYSLVVNGKVVDTKKMLKSK